MKPKLTLVGAGPGDPELISVKGLNALAKAGAVLYDALVSKELLNYAPANAKKIFVGKRAGNHSYTQTEINKLIVEQAFLYGNVVRLKGGDPFIFGRGSEELDYAEAFGIETEAIPGISSSTGIPALHKIPLTKRGVNESFWVITGTTSSGKISKDIALAAQSSATVVILMGMKKLKGIVNIFITYGKGESPVAIIQNGSLPDERVALGTVDTIVEKSREKGISSPAIIVIGEVVAHHSDFNYQLMESLTASGNNFLTKF